jgi:hypothetical protein
MRKVPSISGFAWKVTFEDSKQGIYIYMWLYNEFFIILYNILKIAELDCCQIIILSIYVASTHANTHV